LGSRKIPLRKFPWFFFGLLSSIEASTFKGGQTAQSACSKV
jgi:hypothetical protein